MRIYHSTKGQILLLFALPLMVSACQPANNATLEALSTQTAGLETQVAAQATLMTHLATRGPPRVPPPIGTILPTPYQPVRGSVVIEEGVCCVGGKAGDSLDIMIGFQASSPLGQVTQMRLRFGARTFEEEDMEQANWEPFASSRTFPIEIITNWVGYHISVQYMDELGNLSAVYHDDISVEGHP